MQCEDLSGTCTCQEGYLGAACDICDNGFYPTTNTTCSACECDEIGSGSSQCDSFGQCSCKPGYSGTKCDLACECDPVGSADAQCDNLGSCLCKAGYAGVKCDICAQGYVKNESQVCEQTPSFI